MPPRRGNMHVLRGFSIFFFYWNNSNTKLPLIFNKNKVACKSVFIWFYYKYHVGSGIIRYLYVYKLLFIFRNDWIMLSMRQRVGVSIVARCLYKGGPRRTPAWGFPSLPSLLLKNYVAHYKKLWVKYNYRTHKNGSSMFARPK
jgi:hypothetical protein